MTQPPPPPNQPPSQPQGPGYGYPHTPQPAQQPAQPPQPGYGYPAQPPGAPTPAPGHNPYAQQPPAAPNPYGQQSGYGYPQPSTTPMAPYPGAPGGKRKINAQVAIIVAAVVAIALIIGGGVWYSSGKDDGKDDVAASSGGATGGGEDKGGEGGTSTTGDEKVPADVKSRVLFQVPQPEVEKGESVVVEGSWLTDTVYAKSGIAEIVGYDPDSGAKKWTIDLPGPVCQTTPHITEDNRTAIIHQPKMPAKDGFEGCSEIAAIDLDAGKKLWTKTAAAGDDTISFDNVTVGATTVAVGSHDGGAAFDIATGKALWTPKVGDTCHDAGYGGGPKLVAVRKCGSYGAYQLNIQTLDHKTGKVVSEYKMTEGIDYASVVSTDPLVVAADVGDSAGDGSGISDFFSIDNKTGQLRARISAPGEEYAAECDGITRIENCSGVVVGNDRLYLPTEEHDGSADLKKTNEIIAFDLARGKQTGQRLVAGDGYTLTPLRMDGGNVIAYKRPPYDEGGQVLSIDGGSFKAVKLMQNPDTEAVRDVEMSMLPDTAELRFRNGRLFMSEVYASNYGTGEKRYLAIGFGTKG